MHKPLPVSPKTGGYKLKITLKDLGWQEFFEQQWDGTEHAIGRVVLEHKHTYRVVNEAGEWLGELTGKYRFEALNKKDFPAVGDWVVMTEYPAEKKAMIHEVLKRKSAFIRQAAGVKTEEQIVASNVDFVFLVNALNQDFNIRRIERYLLLAYESGAFPVIILTKRDLCDGLEEKLRQVEAIAPGVPIIAVNSLDGAGIAEIRALISRGTTIALLGSSGVGKSTLLNALMGEEVQKTAAIREEDSRGRHTTTHRELFFLPHGGLVIDTPGMREIQLWDGGDFLDTTFSDIEELARECRFSDCKHQTEPGCKIKEAIAVGDLDEARYKSYQKLQREIAFQEKRQKESLILAEKSKNKNIGKYRKTLSKQQGGKR